MFRQTMFPCLAGLYLIGGLTGPAIAAQTDPNDDVVTATEETAIEDITMKQHCVAQLETFAGRG